MSGFVEVPTDVWLDMRLLPIMPRFVTLPRFLPEAYEQMHLVKRPSIDRLLPYHGHAVRIAPDNQWATHEVGALVVDGTSLLLCKLRKGHKTVMRVDPNIASIARLALRENDRTYEVQLDHATILRELQHRAVIVHVDGVHVDYELSLDPKPRRPGIASETDVLQLLARPLEDQNRWNLVGDSPLAVALRRDLVEKGGGTLDDLYSTMATTYIASYELGVPEPGALPDLEAMAPAALRAFYETRILATLRVTVTDPRWTAHLAHAPEWLHVDDRTLPPPPPKPPWMP